jgi:hypothetical protein
VLGSGLCALVVFVSSKSIAPRYPVNGRKRSLRDIAVELQAQGYVNERGKLFNPKSVSSMLGRST